MMSLTLTLRKSRTKTTRSPLKQDCHRHLFKAAGGFFRGDLLSNISPPFGSYALPKPFEKLRRRADAAPGNSAGRWTVSVLRFFCLLKRRLPVDMEVFPTINARLYPKTNRCEKRAFMAPQFFDLEERIVLSKAMSETVEESFIFLDLGANVGFYSLWAVSEARRLKLALQAFAVEPDAETRSRLRTNIAASAADGIVRVLDCAIGGASGMATMVTDARNRGANRVEVAAGTDDTTGKLIVKTIEELCDTENIKRVDVMKSDIEGHDKAALETLFRSGRTELFPHWIIAEVGKNAEQRRLQHLCEDYGYVQVERTRLNVVMKRSAAAENERN